MIETAEGLFKYSTSYGLGIVLSILMALYLFWILRYVLRENSRREERLAQIIDGNMGNLLNSMTQMLTQLAAHDSWEHEEAVATNRAHDHQKSEHEELADAIQKVRVGVVPRG